MATKKRKITTTIVASVTALALLLGGTFAWQSLNQTALNEASDVINPGGRLHDDFDGTNKDVYVENFADEDIFARIQLSEYFAIIANYGKEGAEAKTDIAGSANIVDGKIVDPTYDIHYFDQANTTDEYWSWTTGGETVFMPTFNMNKDSLVADINGIYEEGNVGTISNRDGTQYTEYTEYANGDTEIDTEIYDGDTNMNDEVGTNFDALQTYVDAGNIVTVADQEHTAKDTLTNNGLISMADWLAMVEAAGEYDQAVHGNYWVYDTDGWVYWSAPIPAGEATGLLLDSIELSQVMDDTWYYAINVVAQFVTADDVGKSDDTGFYSTTDGTAPSVSAESLLAAIGVDMTAETEDTSSDTSSDLGWQDGGFINLNDNADPIVKAGYYYTIGRGDDTFDIQSVYNENGAAYNDGNYVYINSDAAAGERINVSYSTTGGYMSAGLPVGGSVYLTVEGDTDNTSSEDTSSDTTSGSYTYGGDIAIEDLNDNFTVKAGSYYTLTFEGGYVYDTRVTSGSAIAGGSETLNIYSNATVGEKITFTYYVYDDNGEPVSGYEGEQTATVTVAEE